MRAFNKLREMVGSSAGSADTSASEEDLTCQLDALLDKPAFIEPGLSAKPKAAPKPAPEDTTPLDLTQAILDSCAETKSAPVIDPAIDNVALSTIIPATAPVFTLKTETTGPDVTKKPARKNMSGPDTDNIPAKPAPRPKTTSASPLISAPLSKTVLPSTPDAPELKLASPRLRTSPSPAPIKETVSPMPSKPALTVNSAAPSDKLTADLAALDEFMKPKKSIDTPRELGPRRKTASLTHMRNDLAQLNKDMSSGEQFYAQSLRRINDLIEYAYETETTLSALEKLEPENAKLRADLGEAKKNLTDQIVRAESAKSKADAYETRYMETRQALEKTQLSLTQMEALRETLSRDLESKDNDLAVLMNKAREIKNAHSLDVKALDGYKAKASELANELSVVMSARLEVETRLHDLGTRFETLKSERDTIERMVKQTRNAQRATEEHNLALKTQLETVLSDVKIFKQQFDAASQNKDAEIGLLRSKLSDLNAELAVKAGVVSRAHDDMADMREKFETAHRGRRKLLEHIESQKSETDHLQGELTKARDEHRQLTSDFVIAQNEIEALRRVNESQSEKLKKYMALNRKPVVNPASFAIKENLFSAPAVSHPVPHMPSQTAPVSEPVLPQEPARHETPVFAISDTPPPLPTTPSVPTLSSEDSVTRPIETPVFEPLSGAVAKDEVTIENITPTAYPDINFDFEPETDRRAPNSPMRDASTDIRSGSVTESDFDREFEKLSAMAPIQTVQDLPIDASTSLKSDAQKIEDALLEFHDLDLLADSAG